MPGTRQKHSPDLHPDARIRNRSGAPKPDHGRIRKFEIEHARKSHKTARYWPLPSGSLARILRRWSKLGPGRRIGDGHRHCLSGRISTSVDATTEWSCRRSDRIDERRASTLGFSGKSRLQAVATEHRWYLASGSRSLGQATSRKFSVVVAGK